MTTVDKRKETSRLNALKSTGTKTPEGKCRSAFNAVTHAAYVKELILPGEELPQFQVLLDAHLDNWKPTNPIEDIFVFEMASTLWRLRRQAPAESALISIQTHRMTHEINKEFATISPSATYALAVLALQERGDALNQISRQGRRLLSQYEKLTQQLLNMRQLFPPVAPEAPDFEPQNEGVETNLTEDHQPTNESTESETAETEPVETEPVEAKSVETNPVETKLIDSVSLNFPFPRETQFHNPHSILYVALNPISQIAQPTPTAETEPPTKAHSASCV